MIIKSLLIAFACCIFVIASSGCNTTQITSRGNESNSIQETSNDMARTYRLIAVNGATIPATVSLADAQNGTAVESSRELLAKLSQCELHHIDLQVWCLSFNRCQVPASQKTIGPGDFTLLPRYLQKCGVFSLFDIKMPIFSKGGAQVWHRTFSLP